MFWKKEKPTAVLPPVAVESQKPPPTPEASIAQAILSYQRSFYNSLQTTERTGFREAQRLVARATQIVRESRLGPALVPTLLEHIQHWPSWSKRDDFGKYVKFPANNVSGEVERLPEVGGSVSKIYFTYNGNAYGLIFTDEGSRPYSSGDTYFAYGKVELTYQGYSVFGLDISQDLSNEHSVWRWQNVLAFVPGTWMKELIEMAAYIEAAQQQYFTDFTEKDALERARRIKL
ncbi:hypothetical protein FNL55_15485 [Tardiphaga sp. vice352]|uniref:hypothetical protein n=1 Tax=unclassified Tardiphaga TaxID=2631404 RepID=UPI0011653AF2|nr:MULTISPECIES: hypothetical protein [unclassified Tardiphaga]QDM17236.1 hypothetical protein FNL53_15775 [Tardiphaga sp. vice278]QDM32598.1 hypothetical protein FNL55_15485 [Tardiphaga sp. vice352]